MSTILFRDFECHMYVSKRGTIGTHLPAESEPMRVARFEPMPHEDLIDLSFRRLLAAFESIPRPLAVQV